MERLDDALQQHATAAVHEIGLDMADETMPFVHGHAAQIVEGPCFPWLDRDAGIGVSGAVVCFVAQQLRLRAAA
jgi:hypothetical protein